ncbi:uracil-DNA glycosylase [Marinitoga sp. 38H-ov]|uniref:uracil-DNA glycosylase n=1 Tax=Marinitoga sp. 38H-ov TaxID=1755814 RepID=UPI0013E9D2A7|nr:uracil-DNA glycosylase [Marinitoga sp. 38H-ov]KAF2956876.1 uracil-DNA glycosylase [Marinitoga sp. 38H-ov]
MKECKWFFICPMKKYYEKRLISKKWIDSYCKSNWKKCIRYQKEEQGIYHEDWMLPDGTLDMTLKNH